VRQLLRHSCEGVAREEEVVMDERLERLLSHLSPEQLEELASAARERKGGEAQAPGVRMTIRLTEGATLRESSRRGAPARSADDPTLRALKRLSPELRAALIKAEPEVLAWLRASHANRTRFMLDPVAALKEAVPKFDGRLIKEIAALRATTSRHAVDVPGLKLDSLRLEVASQDKVERR
jgi:hypothetical protein